jgi:hypothetical protein
MEKVVLFYIHLKYIRAIWYILWPLGNSVAIWFISPRFGILCQEKSGNPGTKALSYPGTKLRILPTNLLITNLYYFSVRM